MNGIQILRRMQLVLRLNLQVEAEDLLAIEVVVVEDLVLHLYQRGEGLLKEVIIQKIVLHQDEDLVQVDLHLELKEVTKDKIYCRRGFVSALFCLI